MSSIHPAYAQTVTASGSVTAIPLLAIVTILGTALWAVAPGVDLAPLPSDKGSAAHRVLHAT